MHRLLPLAVATVGCAHSYTAISYDLTHRATGTVQTAVPRSGQHSGSVAIGFGTRAAELELVLVEVRWACRDCQRPIAAGALLVCPDCGAPARLIEGDDLVLERLEMEVA